MRKLIITGNGLGMALDPVHFSLTNALADVWNIPNFLTDGQKKLIERCTRHQGPPEGEDELNYLHQAVTHCKALRSIGSNDIHWLTEDGINFPEITSIYIHKVATRLHNCARELPTIFKQSLIDFIKRTNSHVATLNYDKLLYNAFIDASVVSGYDGNLIDGLVNSGFPQCQTSCRLQEC